MSNIFKRLIAASLTALPVIAMAGGLEVSPATLELRAISETPVSSTLHVVNPTSDVQLFEVSADDFADSLKINPTSFTLESGARRDVTITYEGTADQSKKIQTLISTEEK